MNWMELLSPVIGVVLTTMTVWALNWLRKYLQEKYKIEVSSEDFAVAKRVVLAVEEKALTGKLVASKAQTAITDLKEARPEMDDKSVIRKIDQAVAELPNVGATGKQCDIRPENNPNQIMG